MSWGEQSAAKDAGGNGRHLGDDEVAVTKLWPERPDQVTGPPMLKILGEIQVSF